MPDVDRTRLTLQQSLMWQKMPKLCLIKDQTLIPLHVNVPETVVYSVLLTLLACIQSVDNLFQSVIILWKKMNSF